MTEPSSITINGVPATISRRQVIDFIKTLGIDPLQITKLEIGLNAITVEVIARGVNGKPYLDPMDRDRMARHLITIPVVDAPLEEPTEESTETFRVGDHTFTNPEYQP